MQRKPERTSGAAAYAVPLFERRLVTELLLIDFPLAIGLLAKRYDQAVVTSFG